MKAAPEACHGSRLRDDAAAPELTESGVLGCVCMCLSEAECHRDAGQGAVPQVMKRGHSWLV